MHIPKKTNWRDLRLSYFPTGFTVQFRVLNGQRLFLVKELPHDIPRQFSSLIAARRAVDDYMQQRKGAASKLESERDADDDVAEDDAPRSYVVGRRTSPCGWSLWVDQNALKEFDNPSDLYQFVSEIDFLIEVDEMLSLPDDINLPENSGLAYEFYARTPYRCMLSDGTLADEAYVTMDEAVAGLIAAEDQMSTYPGRRF